MPPDLPKEKGVLPVTSGGTGTGSTTGSGSGYGGGATPRGGSNGEKLN
jgi:hypothetical protein